MKIMTTFSSVLTLVVAFLLAGKREKKKKEVGEKIICFESLGQGPEINLCITSSISFLITFWEGGGGWWQYG